MNPLLLVLFKNKYVGIGLVALVSFVLLGVIGIFIPIFNWFLGAGVFFVLAYFLTSEIYKGKNYSITLRTVFALTGLMIIVVALFGQSISSLTASMTAVASVGSVSDSPLTGLTDALPLPLGTIASILGATVGIASLAIVLKPELIGKKRRGRK